MMLTLKIAMSPQEVQERLKLNQLKDKIWYVVPSCATTGEGLFEGLVSLQFSLIQAYLTYFVPRDGSQTTSRPSHKGKLSKAMPDCEALT